MTLDDFIKELEEVSAGVRWALLGGRWLRAFALPEVLDCCPIAVVALKKHGIQMKNYEVTERAHEIGLSYRDALAIAGAADNIDATPGSVRAKLLTACKLTEAAN